MLSTEGFYSLKNANQREAATIFDIFELHAKITKLEKTKQKALKQLWRKNKELLLLQERKREIQRKLNNGPL